MAQTPGQQRAADAVAAELARRGWTNADLREATREPDSDDPPVDGGTIGDFLAYKRWPKIGTLGKFERALDFPAGSLRQLALNGTPIPKPDESVSPSRDDEPTLLYRKPEELTNDEWRELIARTEPMVEWEIEKALRKRRGQ